MSFCATAMSAAKTAVDAPTQVTTVSAVVVPPVKRAGLHQRIDARDEVNAGGDHGGRVNQRGDRRGAFHRVRQPHVQRELAALARGSGKDQQADSARCGQAESRRLRQQSSQRPALQRTRAVVVEEQRAGLREEPDDSKKKENIADARGDEGLFRCRCGRGLLIPEADQQVRRKSDQLPAHEQQQQAVGDHHAQHRSGKQRQEAEEARVVLVVRHVADGVDEDQQADEADHHQHDGRERIEHPAQVHIGRAHANPGEVDGLAHGDAMRPAADDVYECNQREQERKTQATRWPAWLRPCAAVV